MSAGEMDGAAAPQPAKLDPETLAIRARVPRAIRFKRGAIIGLAAFGSVSLTTIAWMALKPHIHTQADNQADTSQPGGRANSDALSGAPATYGDVPKLGPPLPGDLGKPILEHQQSTVAAIDLAAQQRQQQAAAEHERRLAEFKAARESGVLIQGRQVSPSVEAAGPPASAVSAGADGSKLALDPDNDPNAQGHKAEFVSALDTKDDVNPHALTPLPSPYTLSAGSVIAASLITGLRSDLPGIVVAQVTENVYDSTTGKLLLVPQGARLIGSYDSVVAFGQKRALLIWQRIVMPDGSSLHLDNMPATDPSGYAGLQDKVDFHTWQLLKGVAISTLLGIGADLQFSGNGGLIDAIRQSGEQNVSRAGDQLTSKTLNIQPTITISGFNAAAAAILPNDDDPLAASLSSHPTRRHTPGLSNAGSGPFIGIGLLVLRMLGRPCLARGVRLLFRRSSGSEKHLFWAKKNDRAFSEVSRGTGHLRAVIIQTLTA